MTLQEFCYTLPKNKQIKLAIKLAKQALPIWDNYADNNILSYRDTVVGLTHTVPKQLLSNTINEIENHFATQKLSRIIKDPSKLLKLYSYFDDPIVALQDSDWELPEQVKKTFYSVYNLIGSIIHKNMATIDESRLYITINQAIDAIKTADILSENQINQILQRMKNGK